MADHVQPPEKTKLAQNTNSFSKIIFILGGPGSGKGTQCGRIVRKYKGIRHLSVGDVLRAERDTPGSVYADIIAKNMRLGRIDPIKTSTKLLHKAMNHAAHVDGINTFLVDGIVFMLN